MANLLLTQILVGSSCCNFLWSNNQNVQKPPSGFQAQEKKPTMEEAFTQFMTRTNAFIDDTQANFRHQGASIRNLEHQVGEISKLLTERAQGALPSNTERNPREEAKAITLRSGKELEKSKEASKQVIEEDNSVSKDQPINSTPSHILNLHLMPSIFIKD